MATKIEVLVHAAAFLIFASTIYHNIANIFIKGTTDSYGGRFKFLTFINLLLSVGYYAMAFFGDLFKIGLSFSEDSGEVNRSSSKKNNGFHSKLIRFRDVMFGAFVFPIAIVVTTAFWGVMAVNSELMLPSHVRHIIPVNGFYNHGAHSLPMIMALIELYFVSHLNYPNKKTGLLLFSFFCIIYVTWLFWVAYRANIWVYPVLQVLSWPGVFAFLGGFYSVGGFFFLIGHRINSCMSTSKREKYY